MTTFTVLFLYTRPVLIPLKTLALAALSLTAGLGAAPWCTSARTGICGGWSATSPPPDGWT
ncbi:hypothetical protein ACOBQB_14685 [Streptomyces sp. G5(2025)]|uniref:hypothetical protein n=1 Tax=Streptomyces sp. G5(2025) TaxID=3406628 RepID=UPI003C26D84A